ncbi:hypothetical protein EG329_010047 [Mollisiaceae sp. DMI_Dod_QoI]|nr:hypothetical protein EG329_010047 [Helotiales sp. DMI_Dod_QoI]
MDSEAPYQSGEGVGEAVGREISASVGGLVVPEVGHEAPLDPQQTPTAYMGIWVTLDPAYSVFPLHLFSPGTLIPPSLNIGPRPGQHEISNGADISENAIQPAPMVVNGSGLMPWKTIAHIPSEPQPTIPIKIGDKVQVWKYISQYEVEVWHERSRSVGTIAARAFKPVPEIMVCACFPAGCGCEYEDFIASQNLWHRIRNETLELFEKLSLSHADTTDFRTTEAEPSKDILPREGCTTPQNDSKESRCLEWSGRGAQ